MYLKVRKTTKGIEIGFITSNLLAKRSGKRQTFQCHERGVGQEVVNSISQRT